MANERRQGEGHQNDGRREGDENPVGERGSKGGGERPRDDGTDIHGDPPGRDKEAVRRGDASQQTVYAERELKPEKGDQAAKDDRKGKP